MDSTDDAAFDAWIAGFFDGEGCISISTKQGPHNTWTTVHVSACQSEPQQAPLYDIQAKYGGHIYTDRPKHERWKERYTWHVTAQADVHRFLIVMIPHLRIKRARAEYALEVLGEPVMGRGRIKGSKNVPKTHCKYGHEFTVENTGHDPRGYRYCRECNTKNAKLWREIRKQRGYKTLSELGLR